MLKISLLGTPQLSLNGTSLATVITGRELALLAYLATTGKAHERSALVDLLWQDITEQQALKNLRNVLYNLRKSISSYLDITRQTLALNADSPYWLDVTIFDNYWATEQHIASQEMLPEILKLYRGNFLDGFSIQDAPIFETWLMEQQRIFQQAALHGLRLFAEQSLAAGNYETALATARQSLSMAPWQETAHQQMMLILAHSGDRSAALAQYALCQQALAAEYGVAPMPETTALYMQIRAGQLTQQPIIQAGSALIPAQESTQESTPGFTPAPVITPLHDFSHSHPATQVNWDAIPIAPRLYGRATELYQLEQWLLIEECRLVAVLGIGGQGKTALLADFVHLLAEKAETRTAQTAAPTPFARILWSSVTRDSTLTQILYTWIQQLATTEAYTFTATPPEPLPPLDLLLARLIHALRKERCLLILDQAEELWQLGTKETEAETLALLFRWVAENQHQSCLIFSSRVQPYSLARLVRQSSAARILPLAGLTTSAGGELLRRYGLDQPDFDLAVLVKRYVGNPLALTLLAEIAPNFPPHALATIFQQERLLFDELHSLLRQQFDQLSSLAQKMAIWLATEQGPVAFELLWEYFLKSHHASAVMTAYHQLQQALFIEQDTETQMIRLPLLLEIYATQRLVDQLVEELNTQDQFFSPLYLNTYQLLNPQRSDTIQAAQKQFILHPILKALAATWGIPSLIRRFDDLLSVLNTYPLPIGRHAKSNLQTLLAFLEPQTQINNDYLIARRLMQPTVDRHYEDDVSQMT